MKINNQRMKLLNVKMMVILVISVTLLNLINCTQVSLGNLKILSHPQSSNINKSITLSPLAYQQHLPNLQMMRIRIVKAVPFDACSPLDKDKIFSKDKENLSETFVLVDGKLGDCRYWKKSEIAMLSMVKGIIIIDDDHEKNSNQAYDYNNGQFYSFLIEQKDADILLAVDDKQVQAKLSIFQSQALPQKKKINLWLSSLNQQSYNYLDWWNQTITNIPEIKQKLTWQPKYVFYDKQQSDDTSKEVYSCACGGIFCSPQYHGKTTDVLIKQDLRQKLIFQKSRNQYLPYIKLFTQKCLPNYLKNMYIQQCSKTQMITLEINASLINKQVQQFILDCDREADLFGKLLTDKGRFSMIGTYPAILMNREILQFSNQNQLQALLCRKLSLEQSQGCIQYYRTTIKQIIVSIAFFLLILLGLFGVGFFVVMCYKNRLRKQMHKQVRMQVSTAVQHYFQLSQQMSNRNK